MEPESSLLCLKGTTKYPCATTHQSSPGPLPYFLKFNFNIIIPCTPTSSKQSRLLRFPHLTPVFTSPVPLYAASLSLISFFLICYQMISRQYISWTSSVTLTLSGPGIFLSTLFSKTLSLCYHLTDKNFTPTWNKTVLYILMFAIWINTRLSGLNGSRHSQSLICS